MSKRFNDDSRFTPYANRINSTGYHYDNQVFDEQSSGITVVVEKRLHYTFIGDNPLVQIESDHVVLESQLTSRVVAFIPRFSSGDTINITISGNEQDLENIMIYELLEDPSGDHYLITKSDDE